MPSGGYRPGAGRKRKDAPVQRKPPPARPRKPRFQKLRMSRKTIIEQAVTAGMTPLQYMLNILRDEDADVSRRDQMAVAAAPYVHARLSAIEHSGETKRVHVIKSEPTTGEWVQKHNVDVDQTEIRH